MAFEIVWLCTRVTKGEGRCEATVAMVFKLLVAVQERWRRVDGCALVSLVRAGAMFVHGRLVERPDRRDEEEGTDDQEMTEECAV